MKYAIISDVHANLEAVEACFREIGKLKADRIICLGDLVDYCAEPNEVIELIKMNCDAVILGNHDEAQFNHKLSDGFSDNAKISSVITRSLINPQYIEYFKTLPYTFSENDLLFVHASPLNPRMYKYLLTPESAESNFSSFSERVCFIGHSHRQLVFETSGKNTAVFNSEKLDPKCRYIINVGSVGQPRDGNPKLSFGIFDTESFDYKNIRAEYNIHSASEKIKNLGLPLQLAERLYKGI